MEKRASSGRRPIEAGPISGHVATNVRRLRERAGLTLGQLSERMAAAGRPILPSGLSKIEQGQRSVDVDDLVALALALSANPNALLLPPEPPAREVPRRAIDIPMARKVALTKSVTAKFMDAWRWANGVAPLDAGADQPFRLSDLLQWFEATRPHEDEAELAASLDWFRREVLEPSREVARRLKEKGE